MKIEAVKAMTETELQAKVQDLRQEFLNLKIQQQSGRLERPSRLREIRRTVARIKTVLAQKEREKVEGESKQAVTANA